MGKENYRKFVRDVSREMKNITYTNTTTIALLKKYKQMNWKKFLSGWVYEGKYEVFSFESFGDKDKNGVVDIIDFYKKNPLVLPAGYGQTP